MDGVTRESVKGSSIEQLMPGTREAEKNCDEELSECIVATG